MFYIDDLTIREVIEMDVQGKWWLLEEDEPFDETSARQIVLDQDAAILGERRGTWSQTADRLMIEFPATGEAPERRLFFGLAGDRNMLSGTLYDAFSGFPEGFTPGRAELPDDLLSYVATLVRVEPVSADVIEMDFRGAR